MFFNLLALSAAILLNGRTADAQTAGSPCASVSSMSAAWISRFPEATQARVPAQQIEDCVKSIPIDVAEDQALIQELAYYVSWQSTIAYLKNPPESYKGEQVDIVGALTTISKDLADGKYDDEFSLQFDIQAAVKQTYDFHFEWKPDILGLFTFLRGNLGRGLQDEFALVSVSSDGKALPELYNYCKFNMTKLWMCEADKVV
jgi:hypothetical protein